MTSSRPFAAPVTVSKGPIRLVETGIFQLALTYTLVFTAAMAGFAGLSYWHTSHNLSRVIDLRLTDQMNILTERYPTFVTQPQSLTNSTNRFWYWIILSNGQNVGTPMPIKPAEARFQHFHIASTLKPGAEPDSEGRALVRKLSNGTTLVVGDDISDEDELRENLLAAFYILPGLTLVTGLGFGLTASLGALRRLRRITGTAAAIMQGDLNQRIPHQGSRNELDRLAATLNEMLERIASLMSSLQQVSNDIAHDLRTPLTHLRLKLEQLQNGQLSKDENLLTDVDGLLATFDSLLRLARIEAGSRREKFTSVNLTELVHDLAATYQPLLEERQQPLILDLTGTPPLSGDPQLLKQLGANLLENALHHVPVGTPVTLALRHQGTDVVWIFSDSGPGIAATERDNVLERFYRLDRSRGTPGNGLGLSLVSAIVALHHGKLELTDANPGLCVIIKLPLPLPG